jgi:hypothetical protein
VTISVKRRTYLPEGTTVGVEITDAGQSSGQFGEQLKLSLKVIDGEHAGYKFTDWCKLTEEDGKVFVKEGTKAFEVIEAVLGNADTFSDPQQWVGKRLLARLSLRGKKKNHNGLEFGSIGPYEPPKPTDKRKERPIPKENDAELDAIPF